MRCLLVDDEPGIREGLATLLRLRGLEVHAAGDMRTARELLATHGFDVVITDWCLPDGTANDLITAATCPVVVVSGHPEEVAADPKVVAVLVKPVLPMRLIALLAEITAAGAPAAENAAKASGIENLPIDVRRVVLRARDMLSPEDVRIIDDGAFVMLQARWPGDHLLSGFEQLGGDLRILAPRETPRLEIRWCRDGRPDPSLPVIRVTASWPELPEFCVDFDDTMLSDVEFGRYVDRAVQCRAAGRVVHFLNVSPELRDVIESSGRGAELPMREPIGPRIPADLTELWS